MNAQPRRARVMQTLRARLLRRHPGLLRTQHGEALPITLGQRRIYVLPSAAGFGYGAMLLVMLLGALNYNNNAALLLTCLLGAACAQSMYGAFRTLYGLRIDALHAASAHAGSTLTLQLRLDGAGRTRHALRVHADKGDTSGDLPAQGAQTLTLPWPAARRGWQALPALKLESSWPFGLFRAWSWLRTEARVLIYPALEAEGPPAPDSSGHVESARRSGGEDDPAGLREYRACDPPRRIAWKASARTGDLLLRLHEPEPLQADLTLRWADTAGLAHEARIMRLARWVAEAHRAGSRWRLQLPAQTLGPDRGAGHYHACMSALALLP